MEPSIRQDFAVGIRLDNGLLTAGIASGEEIPKAEVLSLVAAVQAIYLTATLESRQSDRIDECHRLWTEVAQLFDELCGAWTNIDSSDPQIAWLRRRLQHFAEISRDRTSLYDVSERQRLIHAANREPGLGLEFRPFSERAE